LLHAHLRMSLFTVTSKFAQCGRGLSYLFDDGFRQKKSKEIALIRINQYYLYNIYINYKHRTLTRNEIV